MGNKPRFSHGVINGHASVYCLRCSQTAVQGSTGTGCVHGAEELIRLASVAAGRIARQSRDALDAARRMARAEVRHGE